jgi:hypothetical protein
MILLSKMRGKWTYGGHAGPLRTQEHPRPHLFTLSASAFSTRHNAPSFLALQGGGHGPHDAFASVNGTTAGAGGGGHRLLLQ